MHTALANDVVPAADNVFITSVSDASLAASWTANAAGNPMPAGAKGVLVAYMVDGAPRSLPPSLDLSVSGEPVENIKSLDNEIHY